MNDDPFDLRRLIDGQPQVSFSECTCAMERLMTACAVCPSHSIEISLFPLRYLCFDCSISHNCGCPEGRLAHSCCKPMQCYGDHGLQSARFRQSRLHLYALVGPRDIAYHLNQHASTMRALRVHHRCVLHWLHQFEYDHYCFNGRCNHRAAARGESLDWSSNQRLILLRWYRLQHMVLSLMVLSSITSSSTRRQDRTSF